MKTLMKNGVRLALAQMPVVAGNPRANAAWMMKEIALAKTRAVDIIVFPELCVPGYLIGDELEDESFIRDVWCWNDRIVETTNGSEMVVIFGTYVSSCGRKCNRTVSFRGNQGHSRYSSFLFKNTH